MDEFVGINLHYWSPQSVPAVYNVREYHFWKNNQLKSDPTSPFAFQPDYHGVDFDNYYETVSSNHLVMPSFALSLEYFYEGDDFEENISCLFNPPLEDGDDGNSPEHYFYHADYMFQYAARYGNTAVDLNLISPRLRDDQTAKSGLGFLNYMENWNEPDFDNTCSSEDDGRRFSALQYAAMLSADYDGHNSSMIYSDGNISYPVGMKNADPSMNAVLAGLTDFDYAFVDELDDAFNLLRGDMPTIYPFDIINFHHYNDGNNEGFNTMGSGVAPEEDIWENRNFKQQLDDMGTYAQEKFGSKELWLTEFGYSTDPFAKQASIPEFPIEPAISTPDGDIDNLRQDLLTLILPNWFDLSEADRAIITSKIYEAQGQWLVRGILEGSASKFDKVFIFDISDDYPEPFCLEDDDGNCKRSNGLAYRTAGILESQGEGYEPKVSYYYASTVRNVLSGLVFDNSDQTECSDEEEVDPAYITDASINCPRIYEYSDPTGTLPNVFAFWSPTVTDKAAYEHKIILPPGTTKATIVEMVNHDIDGSYTIVSDQIEGNILTVEVTERAKFLILDEIFKCVSPPVQNLTASAISCTTVDLEWINPLSPDCLIEGFKIFYGPSDQIADPRNPDLTTLTMHEGEFDGSTSNLTIAGLEANTCYTFFLVICSEDNELTIMVGVNAATLPEEEFCWINIYEGGNLGSQVSSLTIDNSTGQNPISFFQYEENGCIGCGYLEQEFGAEADGFDPFEDDITLGDPTWNYYNGNIPDDDGGGGFVVNFTESYTMHALHLFDGPSSGNLKIEFLDLNGDVLHEVDYFTETYLKWKNIGVNVDNVHAIHFDFEDPGAYLYQLLICGSPSATGNLDGECISDIEYSCNEQAEFELNICDFTVVAQSANGLTGQWDMGDGTTYMNQSFVLHTYSLPGDYKITYTAGTPCFYECSEWISVPEIIEPNSNFTINHSGCNLYAQMVSQEDDWSHDWYWYGAGETGSSNEVNPLFDFPDPGTYIITHTVSADGCGETSYSLSLIIPPCIPNISCDVCAKPRIYSGVVKASEIFTPSNNIPNEFLATGWCAEIQGTLVIDENLTCNASMFKMGLNSQVIVETGKQLTLRNNNEFSGCNTMWKGIYVREGGSFFASSAPDLDPNRIEDALIGVSFRNPEMGLIQTLEFDRNFIGVHVRGNANTVELFWNTFDCSTPLLDLAGTEYPIDFNQSNLPEVSNISYCGLWTSSSGSLFSNADRFKNMANGIIALNSDNLEIDGLVISDIIYDNYPISENGIYAKSETTGGFLNVQASGTLNTIQNVKTGIFVEGVNLSVSDIDILNIDKGVVIEMSNNVNVEIETSKIEAEEDCILFNSCMDVTALIDGNTLHAGTESYDGNASAISLLNSVGSHSFDNTTIFSEIKSNNINLVHTDGGSNSGVYTRKSKYFSFEGNNIQMLDPEGSNTYSKAFGFQLDRGKYMNVSCNQIYSNSTDFSFKRYGFDIKNTEDSYYSCNNIQRTQIGMRFHEICFNSILKTNNFNHHDVALRLETPDTKIGPQENHGNTWSGEENIGASFVSLNLQDILLSRFEINTPFSCTDDLWPCNIDLPAGIPNNLWFIQTPAPAPENCEFQPNCGIDPQVINTNPCEGSYTAITEEEIGSEIYPLGIPWLLNRGHLSRISTWYENNNVNENPCGPTITIFTEGLKQSNLAALQNIEISLEENYEPNIQQMHSFNFLNNAIQDSRDIVHSIKEELHSANSNETLLLKEKESEELDLLAQNLRLSKAIRKKWNSERKEEFIDIFNLNQGITGDFEFEQNEKIVNAIYLKSIFLNSRVLTGKDRNTIYEMAIKCPMDGGPDAVYLARSIADLLKMPYVVSNCSSSERDTEFKRKHSDFDFTILPNPADEIVKIEYSFENRAERELKIFNNLGIIKENVTLSESDGTLNILTEKYVPGIYYISIREDGNTVISEKLLIQR